MAHGSPGRSNGFSLPEWSTSDAGGQPPQRPRFLVPKHFGAYLRALRRSDAEVAGPSRFHANFRADSKIMNYQFILLIKTMDLPIANYCYSSQPTWSRRRFSYGGLTQRSRIAGKRHLVVRSQVYLQISGANISGLASARPTREAGLEW